MRSQHSFLRNIIQIWQLRPLLYSFKVGIGFLLVPHSRLIVGCWVELFGGGFGNQRGFQLFKTRLSHTDDIL